MGWCEQSVKHLWINPRVGGSRPVPNGITTLPLSPGADRRLHCLAAFLREPAVPTAPLASSKGRDSGRWEIGVTRASDGTKGNPNDAQHWWGKRA